MYKKNPIAAAVLVATSLTGSTLFATDSLASDRPSLEHGVSAGDVRSTSAVIWSRTDTEAVMNVRIAPRLAPQRLLVYAEDDYTGKIIVGGLQPNTEYTYEVWFSNAERPLLRSDMVEGTFRTAPESDNPSAVTLTWGGDLAGQNVCRDVDEGFPIFSAVSAMEPDIFVGLGDMVYADGTCDPVGRYGNNQVPGDFDKAANMADFWAHWRYNREDEKFASLLASAAYVGIWDDHEVVNDFGPLHDTRDEAPYTPGEPLTPMGLRAFLDYTPILENPNTPDRLYRSLRWGQHMELIVLDNRQYRDANLEADDETFVKTMLGREQVAWLRETLESSDATWKVIVSSVPISIPTGFPPELGRDGWADFDQDGGFERELADLFQFMSDEDINNVVFITTDVHFAEVFRYTPVADDPNLQIYEAVTGPLNAGLFPNLDFDTDFGTESLFFYGPESSDAVTTYEEALPWMNFGALRIDDDGEMTLSVHDMNGNAVYENTLMPK